MAAGIIEFGEFHLDCERFELRRNDLPLRLERQPMELLILLASSGGRLVTRDEIAHRLWDSEVFVDTEHGINTAIRKIRHTLREDPDSPRFLQTVTGKGYRFVGVTTIAPSTNPGAASSPAAPSPAEMGSHRRSLLIASAAAASIILIGGATFGARVVRGHTARPAITSIAVLPLDNLTGDLSQNYLADGMTDELTTQLAKDSTLRVISRTSVMQYKGAHRPLPEIARQLNVDGILEGSLSRSGTLLHVTVQLIQGPTDTHLWAESYDRDSNDLVSLPEDAALSIAKETHSSVASPTPHRYINPAAHDAYLRGRYLWFSGHDVEAAPYFIKATQLQPDYALAWTGVSSYYGAAAVARELDPRQALPLAREAALKSIQLDPTLPEAHLVVATNYWLDDWNFNAAIGELDKAIQLDPKYAEAWHLRSKILIQVTRYKEGIDSQRQAMEINPFERPWAMVFAYLRTRQFDAAIADARQRLESRPDPDTWGVVSQAYAAKGMDKESEHAVERFLILTHNSSTAETLHRIFARGGRDAVLHYRIDYLKSHSPKEYASPYLLASYYAQLGDKQQALAYLDECIRQHAPPIFDIENDASFDFLHSDPHYRAIVQKVGLPPAW